LPRHVLPWTGEKDPSRMRDVWDHLATVTAANRSGRHSQGGLTPGDQASAGHADGARPSMTSTLGKQTEQQP
jgi:hypothetical protein